MTSFGAYDAGLPCKNPNCKSHGIAHPNCKCYAAMASGGTVEPFCATNQMHKKDCQYFAEGGEPAPLDFDSMQDDSQTAPQQTTQSFDDMKSEHSDFDSMQDDSEKYSTPSQQVLTGVEGVGQGIAGPAESILSTLGAKLPKESGIPAGIEKLGLTTQDIAARQAENPAAHATGQGLGLIGSIASGVGLPAVLSKGAGKIAAAADLGRVGASALSGAISNGALQGFDEISKSLLGQGDPNDAVGSALSNMTASSLFGLVAGATYGKFGNILSDAAETKFGESAAQFLHGFGEESQGLKSAGDSKAVEAGRKLYNMVHSGASISGTIGGAYEGYEQHGILGALAGATLGRSAGHELKYAGPVIAKMISSGIIPKVGEVLDYSNNIGSGLQKVNKAVGDVFSGAGEKVINDTEAGKKLKDYIKQGGIQQNIDDLLHESHQPNEMATSFAEGGEVKSAPIQPSNSMAEHLPEHHVMLEAAKGRISNYLKNLEPADNMPKLAFDAKPDQRQAQRKYDKAISIAVNPLSVMNNIKNGTIETDQIQHLQSMYPEVHSLLQKQITNKITESQLDGKKPPFKVRQGLSLFMGTPLSSELTAPNMMAAQAVFQNKKAQQMQGNLPKKNTSKLSNVGSEYLTAEQARQKDNQKS